MEAEKQAYWKQQTLQLYQLLLLLIQQCNTITKNEDEIIISILLLSYILIKKRRILRINKLKRRWWVRPINITRNFQGDFAHLFQELKYDKDMFFCYTRMDEETFNLLLHKIRKHLEKCFYTIKM